MIEFKKENRTRQKPPLGKKIFVFLGIISSSFSADGEKIAEVENAKAKERYYEVLVKGWEQKVPETNLYKKESRPAYSSHLYLKENEPTYLIHVADLKYSFFPLRKTVFENSLLAQKWNSKLAPEKLIPFLIRLHQKYADYSKSPPEKAQKIFKYKAQFGEAVTLGKNNTSNPNETNQERLDKLKAIFESEEFPPSLKIKAKYNWIEHMVKHSIMVEHTPPEQRIKTPLKYTAEQARMDYNNLLAENDLDPTTKASIQYHLAELDLLGEGLQQPHLISARNGLQAVLDNPDAHPLTRVFARKKLDAMPKE